MQRDPHIISMGNNDMNINTLTAMNFEIIHPNSKGNKYYKVMGNHVSTGQHLKYRVQITVHRLYIHTVYRTIN